LHPKDVSNHTYTYINMRKIQDVIKEHGLTVTEVAAKMGISRVTLSQKMAQTSFNTGSLRKVAEAIGCQLGDFFIDEMSPESLESNTIKCPKCGAAIKLNPTTDE